MSALCTAAEATLPLLNVAARTPAGRMSIPGFSGFTPQAGWLASVSPRIYSTQYKIPDFYRGSTWTLLASTRVLTQDVTVLGGGNFAFTGARWRPCGRGREQPLIFSLPSHRRVGRRGRPHVRAVDAHAAAQPPPLVQPRRVPLVQVRGGGDAVEEERRRDDGIGGANVILPWL